MSRTRKPAACVIIEEVWLRLLVHAAYLICLQLQCARTGACEMKHVQLVAVPNISGQEKLTTPLVQLG